LRGRFSLHSSWLLLSFLCFQFSVTRSLVRDVARPENMWRLHSEKVSNPCTKAFFLRNARLSLS
jgi:hypothetical protein